MDYTGENKPHVFIGNSFMGMKSLVYEKAPGLRDRLRASPLKMWQILLGKFTASFVLVLVQLVFILLLTSSFFKTFLGSPVVSILVLLAAASFTPQGWALRMMKDLVLNNYEFTDLLRTGLVLIVFTLFMLAAAYWKIRRAVLQ
ncbi:MAG: hypothetical protein JG781_1037 [Peptococcaceae bacterium]|jgi:ABC-type Na+ efflux pump permease subunit|nr:hypothetical protein [Peptococcaceae bacterium]